MLESQQQVHSKPPAFGLLRLFLDFFPAKLCIPFEYGCLDGTSRILAWKPLAQLPPLEIEELIEMIFLEKDCHLQLEPYQEDLGLMRPSSQIVHCSVQNDELQLQVHCLN